MQKRLNSTLCREDFVKGIQSRGDLPCSNGCEGEDIKAHSIILQMRWLLSFFSQVSLSPFQDCTWHWVDEKKELIEVTECNHHHWLHVWYRDTRLPQHLRSQEPSVQGSLLPLLWKTWKRQLLQFELTEKLTLLRSWRSAATSSSSSILKENSSSTKTDPRDKITVCNYAYLTIPLGFIRHLSLLSITVTIILRLIQRFRHFDDS